MTAKKKTSALDEPWRHHHVTAPALFAGAVFGVAAVLAAAAVSPWYVLGVGAVATAIAPMVATAVDSPLRTRWYVALLAPAITAWVTWCIFTTPWQRDAPLALIAGAVVFGPWWAVIVRTSNREEALQKAAVRRAERAAEAGHWPELLAQIGFKGVKFVSRVELPAGYSVTMRLPPNGSATYATVYAALGKLEQAALARLNSLRLERGDTAADIVLHVLTREVLAETIPLPVDRSPKSIHDPMPLGQFETGEVAVVTMREIAALMVGVRGSGKSALANTHLARLTGCIDAVVWMIDGKGGRTARPWIEPFLQATTGRPAIDWVATSPAESDAMLLGTTVAVKYRSRGAGEKVIPSAAMPSIILVVEEASLITGIGSAANTKRAGLAQEAVVLGRSEAVDVLLMTQRGTVTMIGNGDMKSQFGLRYGLGVATQADAQAIFPDSKMAAELYKLADNEDYVGAFLMQAPASKRVLPVKGYWLAPASIGGIAVTNSQHRADLDNGTADAVHAALVAAGVPGGYYGRWDRYADQMSRVSGGAVSPGQDAPQGQETSPAGGTRQADPKGLTTAERLGLPESKLVPSPLAGVSQDAEFADIVRNLQVAEPERPRDTAASEARPAPAERVPTILVTVARIFTTLGADRLHTQRILDELPGEMTGRRLSLLMNLCGVSVQPEPLDIDGKRARGYLAADIHRALGRARAGYEFPQAAYDWPDQ